MKQINGTTKNRKRELANSKVLKTLGRNKKGGLGRKNYKHLYK